MCPLVGEPGWRPLTLSPSPTIALSDDAGWAAAAGGGGALVVSDARGSIHGTVVAASAVPARVALNEKDR